jgi:hypothetical protein
MPYKVNLPPFDAGSLAANDGAPIPAKPETLETSEITVMSESSIGSESHNPTAFGGAYHQRVRQALRAIAALDFPEGTVAWVEREYPTLYGRMMVIPWVLIDKLWNDGAPIQQFQSVLDDWVQACHEAKDLYTRFLQTRLTKSPCSGGDVARSVRAGQESSNGGTNEGTTNREECRQ